MMLVAEGLNVQLVAEHKAVLGEILWRLATGVVDQELVCTGG